MTDRGDERGGRRERETSPPGKRIYFAERCPRCGRPLPPGRRCERDDEGDEEREEAER